MEQVEAWFESLSLMLLAETELHCQTIRDLLMAGCVQAQRIFTTSALGAGEDWGAAGNYDDKKGFS